MLLELQRYKELGHSQMRRSILGGSRTHCTLGLASTMGVQNLVSTMPRTKLNLLDENLIPNQFWGRLGAGKVCPQVVLGLAPGRLTGG